MVGIQALRAGAEAALILLGDQPRMTVDLIERVIHAWRSSRAGVVRARFADAPGHPVLVARSEWPILLRATGDAGARDLLAEARGRILMVDVGGEPPVDVDTWEDYERVQR